ncbi:MAG: hypothetical protein R3C26_08810 [Calditrichia bacterium]
MSYPVSAFYNRFLLDEWGLPRYLEFYRKTAGRRPFAMPFRRPNCRRTAFLRHIWMRTQI